MCVYTASSSLNLTPAIYHSPPSFGSGEKIDFLGPADNVKQLLKLPFCGTFAKKCLHKWLRRRYNTTTIKCYWRTVFVIHTLTNSMRALKHTQKSQYLSLYIAWGIHSSSKGASTTTRFYMIFRVRSDILAIHLCSLVIYAEKCDRPSHATTSNNEAARGNCHCLKSHYSSICATLCGK